MKKVMMGNHALSYGAMLARSQVIAAYPITPQTQVVELLSEMCADGTLDAQFIKVRTLDGNRTESIVPKHQIQTIEVLEGTDAAERDDLFVDPWANRQTGMA